MCIRDRHWESLKLEVGRRKGQVGKRKPEVGTLGTEVQDVYKRQTVYGRKRMLE